MLVSVVDASASRSAIAVWAGMASDDHEPRLRVSRRLGVAFVVGALGAVMLGEEDVVFLRLVVLVRVVALLGGPLGLFVCALELVLVPPGADAIEEAHDGKCLMRRAGLHPAGQEFRLSGTRGSWPQSQ